MTTGDKWPGLNLVPNVAITDATTGSVVAGNNTFGPNDTTFGWTTVVPITAVNQLAYFSALQTGPLGLFDAGVLETQNTQVSWTFDVSAL